jgi:hypothetical protein
MADDGTILTTPAPSASSPPAGESAPPPAAAAPFDWTKAGLSPGHQNLVTERGWKGPDDLMTSFRHLESATGVPPERLIKLPGAKDAADPKVWDDIYTRLGRPATADKYVIPVPEGDKGEFAAEVKPVLHKIGLTGDQATKLGEWWNGKVAESQKAHQAEIEARNAKDVTELKQQWGTDYDARATLVDRAAESFGMTQTHLDALKTVMGPKAAMEFLHNIGSKIAVEDRNVPGMSGQSTSVGMTREAALAKLAEYKDPHSGFAKLLTSSDRKQRMEARAEISRLTQIAAPEISPISGSYGQRK